MHKGLKRRYPHFLLSALVTLGVIYLTLMPRPFGQLHVPMFAGADKVVHFLMFFAVAVSYYFDIVHKKAIADKPRLLGWIFLFATVFGGAIELAQSGMGLGRSGDWFDLFADAAGAFYGCVVAWLVIKK